MFFQCCTNAILVYCKLCLKRNYPGLLWFCQMYIFWAVIQASRRHPEYTNVYCETQCILYVWYIVVPRCKDEGKMTFSNLEVIMCFVERSGFKVRDTHISTPQNHHHILCLAISIQVKVHHVRMILTLIIHIL